MQTGQQFAAGDFAGLDFALTRNLASVWLAAAAQGRPEAAAFEARLGPALARLALFDLPEGMPLVGDVSPDCPPSHLACLLPSGARDSGWMGLLPAADRARLAALLDRVTPAPAEPAEGWLRAAFGPWEGLWHAEPEGWSPMPGHGHQDCGSFVLHYEGEPLFVDLGRGSYAVAGEDNPDVAAGAHNGLSVARQDPYPPNRPYYAPAFRARVAGPAVLERDEAGIAVAFEGFTRLYRVGMAERVWRFDGHRLVLFDRVDGRGRVRQIVVRRLHTPWAVERAEHGGDAGIGAEAVERAEHGALILTSPRGRRLRLQATALPPRLQPARQWLAYGESRPVTRIEVEILASLPWTGRIVIEAL